jgi:hypothetical protein
VTRDDLIKALADIGVPKDATELDRSAAIFASAIDVEGKGLTDEQKRDAIGFAATSIGLRMVLEQLNAEFDNKAILIEGTGYEAAERYALRWCNAVIEHLQTNANRRKQ